MIVRHLVMPRLLDDTGEIVSYPADHNQKVKSCLIRPISKRDSAIPFFATIARELFCRPPPSGTLKIVFQLELLSARASP